VRVANDLALIKSEYAMNIRHECPLPDLSFAVAAPLFVQPSGGQGLTVKKWTLKGMEIDALGQNLSKGVILTVPFQGVDISFPIKLAAAETPGNYDFVELTVRQRETLAVFYKGLISGQMSSTNDVITSLDTPVDLVPMRETFQEKSDGVT
jgi:hypothetical protein